MPAEILLKVIDRWPEAILILSSEGNILGANRRVTRLGIDRNRLPGRHLAEITVGPPDTVAAYLRRCTRTADPIPGSLTLKRDDGGEIPCRSDGSVLIPASEIAEPVVMLRLEPKDAAVSQFLELNRKIDRLGREVHRRQRIEQELREQKEWLGVTLMSIGDAVIATDTLGRVVFTNPAARSLTGWGEAEASGRPLDEVFRIVNEITRGPVENPVERVLATGHVVGLANHTVLITADAKEIPIDDSAAPIVTEGGQLGGVVLTFRDVTERRRAQELNQWLAAIVESSDDIIASKTLDGVITSWNKGAERVLGYTAEEVIGRHVSMLMPPELVEDMPRILDRIRRGEKVDHYQTKRQRKDGAIIDVSLTVSPIRDAVGRIIGASKIGRDVTAEKRAREEREELLRAAEAAKAETEAASHMKDEFLATLSHELRTPLNAIIGWVSILSSGRVGPEDFQTGLEVIGRNARAQAQLVEDLLDVSRIISKNFRLDVRRVSLVEVIEAAIAAVMPVAEAKGVRITKVLDSLAGPVSGDPVRLQQVVWNLLSNAVKFTPQGGRVQVLLERVNSHVEITVIDTGFGISPEFLPHVFDRFRQADSSTTRRHSGLGLGLTIVKELTELQGGSVRAKSPGEGQGATFVVTLPITVVHRDTPDQVRPKEHEEDEFSCTEESLSGIRVLVVDDESDARHLLRQVLTACGAEVAEAASAAEALRLIESSSPDILVSDIGMPNVDGYDLIRQVRTRLAAKALPAAALTAFARSEDRRRALLAGFQTHVAKPVDPAELVAVVASLVERTGGRRP
jgi:PAS domain S-box-containing protein